MQQRVWIRDITHIVFADGALRVWVMHDRGHTEELICRCKGLVDWIRDMGIDRVVAKLTTHRMAMDLDQGVITRLQSKSRVKESSTSASGRSHGEWKRSTGEGCSESLRSPIAVLVRQRPETGVASQGMLPCVGPVRRSRFLRCEYGIGAVRQRAQSVVVVLRRQMESSDT